MFKCTLCNLEAPFKHFGASLPAETVATEGSGACRVAFLEQGWLAVDPFSVKPRPLFLGAPCSICNQPVCTADTCSLFFAKRFCAPCARHNASAFPPAVLKASARIFGSSQQQQQQRASGGVG
ncbi:hypothetical protein Agub_g14075 [Astrephomene gubernaculifera]|uniref:Cysteine-rich DPF motif domain-containing protein 1 n=1 Tax=Astrephomene gubernaculifera TaxID=47775 RepID=A0AAD3E2J3_9CHLO|nr:hypothetical protein Agub_g14075 [Astrephomene gubernaculifera]